MTDRTARAKLRAFTLQTEVEAMACAQVGIKGWGAGSGTFVEGDYTPEALTELSRDKSFLNACAETLAHLPDVPFAVDVRRFIEALECEYCEHVPPDPAKALNFSRFVADVFEAGQAAATVRAMSLDKAASAGARSIIGGQEGQAAARPILVKGRRRIEPGERAQLIEDGNQLQASGHSLRAAARILSQRSGWSEEYLRQRVLRKL